ncbi:hypothetical protein DAPPUDRAFT_222755 [Daphnia pulex]|uniref:Uncharacterized protein n=1 Tax=Daphnia pulex TaxID=6669 RepID=E9G5Y7_DAPPU|nr:hypothetical protein DAPPUDRAFT_222755 [Daphnia pulex]|eukprot:EFX85089.1 hypothetical protein DAPPUDRAFT_222755 [Daphnia pulex]
MIKHHFHLLPCYCELLTEKLHTPAVTRQSPQDYAQMVKTVRDVARHRGVKIAWNLSTTKHYHERNEKAAARRVARVSSEFSHSGHFVPRRSQQRWVAALLVVMFLTMKIKSQMVKGVTKTDGTIVCSMRLKCNPEVAVLL